MSGHDSKYFSTTKKGEIPELKEELNSQYKVTDSLSSLSLSLIILLGSATIRVSIGRFRGDLTRSACFFFESVVL